LTIRLVFLGWNSKQKCLTIFFRTHHNTISITPHQSLKKIPSMSNPYYPIPSRYTTDQIITIPPYLVITISLNPKLKHKIWAEAIKVMFWFHNFICFFPHLCPTPYHPLPSCHTTDQITTPQYLVINHIIIIPNIS
jgi:hypothetical protein